MGPTASGKSNFLKKIIKNENDYEIISSDSRQIYKRMRLFSGTSKEEEKYFLNSFLEPDEDFSAGDFVKLVEKKIKNIDKKIIFIGGTSFYIESFIYENFLPKVERNEKLRDDLEKKEVEELREILKKKDKRRFEEIDKNNKVRIIRSIEIIEVLGKVPTQKKELKKNYEFKFYLILPNKKELNKKIEKNFKNRIEKGLIKEAEDLKKFFEDKGFNEEEIENRFKKFGLSYKFIFSFWKNEINLEKFIEYGIKEEQKYAKRQEKFLKRFFKNLPRNEKVNKITILN